MTASTTTSRRSLGFRDLFTSGKRQLRHMRKRGDFTVSLKASGAALAIFLCAMGLTAAHATTKIQTFWLIASASALALYALCAAVERFAGEAVNTKTTALFAALGLGVLAFFAHGRAGGEVNAIFSRDPSNFPHAVAAATSFVVLDWIAPAIVAGLALGLPAALIFATRKQISRAWTAVSVFLACSMMFGAIFSLVKDPQRRASNLYQIARSYDFNDSFECSAGVPGLDAAAFIGPAGDRAIIAPKLEYLPSQISALFPPVAVPKKFAPVDCK